MITMELTAEQNEVMQMAGVANVSCATLTIPTDGSEGEIEIPVGTHIIYIGGGDPWNNGDMGMLLMQMGDGDDGGGGSCLAEDVNNDGVVDVSDLLAIIAVWGSTCP